jgi:uncharacterized coiled-coil DUF342 family protein
MLTSDFFNQPVEENCKYGRYYCTTDKKYKCRQGPKQTRQSEAIESAQNVSETRENYNGINILLQKDDDELFVKASAGSKELGHVLFAIDGEYLLPQDLEVEERFRGQGIAQTMYDFVKSKGYKIRRSGQQTDAGAGFWDKHRAEQNVWEQEETNPVDTVEMDVPLLIRALEYAREDAKDDMDLHRVVERMIKAAQAGETLNMDDYNMIFGDHEKPAVEVDEARRKKKSKSKSSLMSKPSKRKYGGYYYPGYGYYGGSGDSGGGDGGGGGESRVKENVKEAQESTGQDYQKMLQFVNNQRLSGVPADQQVAVALFKELEKQRAINKHMDSELEAAEELVSSNKKQGDVTSSELTKNRSELEKEKIKQQATKQQLQTLAQQLDQLRSTPDIDPEVTSAIEKQIAELQQKMQDTKGTGIDSNKVAELESAIAKIKQSETVDAEQFKKLQQQFKDAEQAAISAKDRVGQVKDYTAQIEKLNAEIDGLTKTISADKKQINDLNVSIASVINPKIQELDKENEFVYNELEQHDSLITQVVNAVSGQNPNAKNIASTVKQTVQQNPEQAVQAQRPPETVAETRRYYRTHSTDELSLKIDFGLRKDPKGWYLPESVSVKTKLDVERAFGEPIAEMNLLRPIKMKGPKNPVTVNQNGNKYKNPAKLIKFGK